MFRAGDAVERDLDGMWFAGEVRAVHRPPPRGYRYDVYYPDTRNVERDVPEDELRLQVSSSSAGSKYAEGTDGGRGVPDGAAAGSDPSHALLPPPQPKLGFVLLTEEGEAAAAAATAAATAATLGASPLTAPDARDRAASSDSASSSTSHVVLHNVDDNERMQSTGTAYLTHGTLDVDPKAAGGGGLRAIRLLRK